MKYFPEAGYDDFRSNVFERSKILVVAGDSFTNNKFLLGNEHHWAYKLGKLRNYDFVFNINTSFHENQAGSNQDIFEDTLKFLNGIRHYEEAFEFGESQLASHYVDIVIMWSSPLRDNSSMTWLYRPYQCATLPDIHSSEQNSTMFRKYYEEWFREDFHSYKTQIYTLFLQEYFIRNKFNYYFSMAFSPLLEENTKGTEWDLRKHINEDRFFGLYDNVNTVQQYLLNKCYGFDDFDINLHEQSFFDERFHGNWYKTFSKMKKYIKISESHLEKIFTGFNSGDPNNPLLPDGHPSKVGTTLMAEFIHERL